MCAELYNTCLREIKNYTFAESYLLLTGFESRTVSYGPSFFRSDLWHKRFALGA